MNCDLWNSLDAVSLYSICCAGPPVRPTYEIFWHLTHFLSDSWALDFLNRHEARQNMNLLQSRICKWEPFYFWPWNFLRLIIHLLLISQSFYSLNHILSDASMFPKKIQTSRSISKSDNQSDVQVRAFDEVRAWRNIRESRFSGIFLKICMNCIFLVY